MQDFKAFYSILKSVMVDKAKQASALQAESTMCKPYQLVTSGFILSLMLGFVGSSDMEDEQKQAALYCQMVAEGSWPEYDKEKECK